MKKVLSYIAGVALAISFAACSQSSSFNQEKALELMEKPTLTSEEYNQLIDLYETGMKDALEFAKKDKDKLTEQEQEEVMTFFAIGVRLTKEESNLSEEQRKKFDKINSEGDKEISK